MLKGKRSGSRGRILIRAWMYWYVVRRAIRSRTESLKWMLCLFGRISVTVYTTGQISFKFEKSGFR